MGGTYNPTTGTWTGSASLDFVTVGNPGNAADTTVMHDGTTGYGAVPNTYQMGKYDVTVGQYCQFLNAMAKTADPYGLYNFNMSCKYPGPTYPTLGINRTTVSGHYSYSVAGSDPQAANCPIFDVDWGEAARFCNWLQNGQPTGAEGPGTTETGAYTLNGARSVTALMAVTRNAGATYFIPSENEWYKAAYYNPSNASYWRYPTQSNTAPSNVLSATGTNNANYEGIGYTDPTNELTPVGAFAASPGPYGTYDMGGDVFQWNETNFSNVSRGILGGCWDEHGDLLAPFYRYADPPTDQDDDIGFRVASDPSGWEPVPEPGSTALLLAGALAFGIWRLRRNA
jgi:formylglycine-generating enzyme required for sulfatase activity